MRIRLAVRSVISLLALSLAACGGGGGGGGGSPPPPPETGITVPLQAAGTTVSYPLNTSSASISFNADGSVAGSALAAADTSGLNGTGKDSVVLTTDGDGFLTSVVFSIAGAGSTRFAVGFTAPFAQPASNLITGRSGFASFVATNSGAGMSYSTYGAWTMVPNSGEFDFGSFAGGVMTPASAIPTSGSATYSGTAIGYGATSVGAGSTTATIFAFGASAGLTANFAGPATGVSATFSNFYTALIGGSAPLPTIPTLTGVSTGFAASGGVNGYSGTLTSADGSYSGHLNGAFFGPSANETAGTFNAANSASHVLLTGGFGAVK